MKTKEYKPLYKQNKKLKEESEEEKALSAIKEIIETDWEGSNSDQGKIAQTFKGLAFNDSSIANKFMGDINKYTTSLKDKYLAKEE